MVRFERKSVSQPKSLGNVRAKRARAEAATFFRSRDRSHRQRQHEFSAVVLMAPDVIAALGRLFFGTCAFCGIELDEVDDRFGPHRLRPPQDAVAADGSTSRRHYWWLAYEWENLYLVCWDCAGAQGAKFPVEHHRARVGSSGNALDKERPLLLDPCRDEPERDLVYLRTGEVVSRHPRAIATIETFALNRDELVRRRHAVQIEVRQMLARTAEALASGDVRAVAGYLRLLFDSSRPFAAARRQFANQWVQVRPRMVERALAQATGGDMRLRDLVGELGRVSNRVMSETADYFFGQSLATVPELAVRPDLVRVAPVETSRLSQQLHPDAEPWLNLAPAEIRSVEIENFRAIGRLRLSFPDQPGDGPWMMLLGENGTGKSSILQAIALALVDPETLERVPLDPSHVLRHGTKAGFVRVRLTGTRRVRTLHFQRGSTRFTTAGYGEGVLVAGYGSTRLLPDGGAAAGHSRIESLFDPRVALVAPPDWLPDLGAEDFDAVARAVKRLLALDDKDELRLARDGGLELRRGDGKGWLSLTHESDGYKAMAAFALDMTHLFLRRWGSLEAAEGIVLVDELGAHLHPRWQMRVTTSLREAFPRVQFIATTHDPLCLRGLRDGEVAVLRKPRHRVFVLQDDLPQVAGLAVDQILTSEHFGLNSTLDPDVERLFERYYHLLRQRDRGPGDEGELEQLRAELAHHRLLGATLRERLALEAADRFLAERHDVADARAYVRLKERTRDRIGEIWREPAAP